MNILISLNTLGWPKSVPKTCSISSLTIEVRKKWRYNGFDKNIYIYIYIYIYVCISISLFRNTNMNDVTSTGKKMRSGNMRRSRVFLGIFSQFK